jgi:hypothetical protein
VKTGPAKGEQKFGALFPIKQCHRQAVQPKHYRLKKRQRLGPFHLDRMEISLVVSNGVYRVTEHIETHISPPQSHRSEEGEQKFGALFPIKQCHSQAVQPMHYRLKIDL